VKPGTQSEETHCASLQQCNMGSIAYFGYVSTIP